MSQKSIENLNNQEYSPEINKLNGDFISERERYNSQEYAGFENVSYINYIRSEANSVFEKVDINPCSKKVMETSSRIIEARDDQLSRQFFVPSEKNSGLISNLLSKILDNNLELLTEERLINDESKIGAEIFGPLEADEYRAFFFEGYKNGFNSWIFHKRVGESYLTFRYEVQNGGILRSSSTDSSSSVKNYFISGEELDNFMKSTEMYYDRVMSEMYNGAAKK